MTAAEITAICETIERDLRAEGYKGRRGQDVPCFMEAMKRVQSEGVSRLVAMGLAGKIRATL